MTEWQPIDTAPRDGTPIDLWFGNLSEQHRLWLFGLSGRAIDWHYRGGKFQPIFGGLSTAGFSGTPTHWMFAPHPPEMDP